MPVAYSGQGCTKREAASGCSEALLRGEGAGITLFLHAQERPQNTTGTQVPQGPRYSPAGETFSQRSAAEAKAPSWPRAEAAQKQLRRSRRSPLFSPRRPGLAAPALELRLRPGPGAPAGLAAAPVLREHSAPPSRAGSAWLAGKTKRRQGKENGEKVRLLPPPSPLPGSPCMRQRCKQILTGGRGWREEEEEDG